MDKKRKYPRIRLTYNGLMWELVIEKKDSKSKRLQKSFPPLKRIRLRCVTSREILVSEDFREIKAKLEKMGISLLDKRIEYQIYSTARPSPTPLVPETPFAGPFDCLIPRPRLLILVPDNVDLGAFIFLDSESQETGGLYLPLDIAEKIGLRFKKVWPRRRGQR